MGEDRTKNKSPARARGDKLITSTNLPPRFYNSEPALTCQVNSQNFENTTEIRCSEWVKNLIFNRADFNPEHLEEFLRDLKASEVKREIDNRDILMETIFLDRNPNKKFNGKPIHAGAIRRHIKVNRANDVKDYWLARISRRPSLILRGFHFAPFLKVHDPDAPELFGDEVRIFNMSSWRSVRRELKLRYFLPCLSIDVDGVSLHEIKARIKRAPVKPSWIVVTSSRGFQLYLLFDKPYEETVYLYNKTPYFVGFKDIYDDLVDIYCADKGSYTGVSYFRIFPYSTNSKHGNFKTFLVKLPKITYTPDEMRELIANYKGYKDYKSPKIQVQGFKFESRGKGKDFWDGTPRGREWFKFLGMLKKRKDIKLWKVYNGKDPKIRYQENGSIRCEILVNMLIIRGFSDQFIVELLKNWSYGLKYGKRADEMLAHPNWEESRIKSLIKHAKKEISEHPEFYILAKMERGKGYSYKAICKLTGFDIVTVRKAMKVLVESGRVYPRKPRKSRKNGKVPSLFYKSLCPKYLQGCQGNYKGFSKDVENLFVCFGVEKTQTLCRENGKEGKKGGARGGKKGFSVEPLGNVLKKMFNIKDSERERNWHEPKKDTHEKRLATPLYLVNPEIASELVKLEECSPSEIKALYRELPKSNPLIAMFEKRVSELGVTGLEKDEAFALWVLQEKAKLNQKPQFHTGFT